MLSIEEARVLGCLLEKEATTPEQYPLSLNALTLACNQKTNRDPVMDLDEDEVLRALDNLREQQLAMRVDVAGSRVPKFRHNIIAVYEELNTRTIALLCVMLLRGPQTIGELRGRTERLYQFRDLEQVESNLNALIEYDDGDEPLAVCLPPRPGKKVKTYAHLLCGAITAESFSSSMVTPTDGSVSGEPTVSRRTKYDEAVTEIENLKTEVASLREEMQSMRESFAEFKKQFE